MKTDIYQRITDQIVSELEKGVRPWLKPWNAEHAAGRITRPLRGNGIPYKGINVLMLWSAAMEKGCAAPVWMTYKQASEQKANVREGEHGGLVIYADKIVRTETDAHWTRHKSRLDRDFGRKRFGDEGYAMEELVAELGSAFLSADLDLMPELRGDHASYIASWIKVLRDDKRAIFIAASQAQRAADFLHELQKSASAQANAA